MNEKQINDKHINEKNRNANKKRKSTDPNAEPIHKQYINNRKSQDASTEIMQVDNSLKDEMEASQTRIGQIKTERTELLADIKNIQESIQLMELRSKIISIFNIKIIIILAQTPIIQSRLKHKKIELEEITISKADADTRLEIEQVQNKELQIKIVNYYQTGVKYPKADESEKEALESLMRRIVVQWLERQSICQEINEIQPIERPNLPDHLKENAYWIIKKERSGTEPQRNGNGNRQRNFTMNKLSKFYSVFLFYINKNFYVYKLMYYILIKKLHILNKSVYIIISDLYSTVSPFYSGIPTFYSLFYFIIKYQILMISLRNCLNKYRKHTIFNFEIFIIIISRSKVSYHL